MAARLLIFDDCRGRFGPLTDLRAIFEQRSGALTTLARIERAMGAAAAALWTADRLAQAVTHRRGVPVNQPVGDGAWRLINGRWLGVHAADAVRALPLGHVLLQHDGQLVAAHLPQQAAQAVIDAGFDPPDDLPAQRLPAPPPVDPMAPLDGAAAQWILIDRPWHLLDQLEGTLASDLEQFDLPVRPASMHLAITGEHPFKAAADATIMPLVSVNTRLGPVVIDAGATVQSFAVLNGPCYLGPRSTINAHADIRPNTVIGPACKVGGEISFSIIQGYTNKAHLGYLGHSLVGSWVNFGAGTTISNLKNNYGPVRMQLEAGHEPQDTGRTFLGPVIGDFTLTAIGSRLLTGSCIGTGTMLALSTFAPKFTNTLSFLTDGGEQQYGMQQFIALAKRMTTRRCCGLRPGEEEVLRGLAAPTRPPMVVR